MCRKVLRRYFLRSGFDNVSKNHFASLMGILHQITFKPEHAVAGFRKTVQSDLMQFVNHLGESIGEQISKNHTPKPSKKE